jgi:hypothetical protein
MGPDVDRIRGQQKESEPIRVDWQKGKEANPFRGMLQGMFGSARDKPDNL